jgi:N-acetylglutamate synthase-like GNAT family acetyltransferase
MEYTITENNFTISTDKNKIDIDYVHQFLSNSYWSPGLPMETIKRAMQNSLCFGVYENKKQVGYARMITDTATFAYLADVFIDENYRGKGLGKWLVKVILAHPDLQGLRRIILATRDAHSLYAQFGFVPFATPERWMAFAPPHK